MRCVMGAGAMIFRILALFLFPAFVHASTWTKETGWLLQPDPNGGYSVLPGSTPAGGPMTTTCTTSSCTRAGSLPTPHGAPRGTMVPSAGFGKSALAAGVLGLGARLLPWVSVGYGIYDWLKAADITVADDGFLAPDSSYSLQSSYYCLAGYNNGCDKPFPADRYSSEDAAVSALFPERYGSSSSAPTKCRSPELVSRSGNQANWQQLYCNAAGSVDVSYVQTFNRVFESACANTQTSVVVLYPLGGKCPTSEVKPISTDQALSRLNSAPVTADVLRKSLDETLDAGGSVADTGLHSVTGPASVPGGTSTKQSTRPDGTTAISVTNTTYNYTYNNNHITVSKVDKTTNPDGSSEQTTSEPEKSDCEKNPNSVGCADLTNNETGKPTWETKNVVYQADSLGMPAACPAPWTGVVHGWNLSMSWQPACDVAPGIRAGVLALAALSALLLIITTVRQ